MWSELSDTDYVHNEQTRWHENQVVNAMKTPILDYIRGNLGTKTAFAKSNLNPQGFPELQRHNVRYQVDQMSYRA